MAFGYEDLIPKTGNSSGSAPVAPAPATNTAPAATDDGGYGGYGNLVPKVAPSPINAPASVSSGDTGNSIFWDMFHPQDADMSRPQTWRDWATKTYHPTLTDAGNAALDDASMGTADWLQSKATGENVADIRARTAQSQAAMGPMGPVLNAATYAIPGAGEAKLGWLGAGKTLGKVAELTRPVVGKAGAAATEGALASGVSSVGHQLGPDGYTGLGDVNWENVGEDATKGAAFGVGGHVVGSTLKAAADTGPGRTAADFVNRNPGRGSPSDLFGITRSHLNAGGDVSQDIANQVNFRSPNDPMQPGLQKAFDATQQSTEPGWLANRFGDAANLGGRMAAVHVLGPVGWMMDNPGGWAKGKVMDVAQGINEGAKTEAIHAGLDQATRDQTGKPLTVNTTNWPDVWKNLAIGGSRQPAFTGYK